MSDDIMYDSKEDCYMVSEERLEEFEKAVTDLESLKSRLPVNADGDVVLWGDEVWWYGPTPVNPASFVVANISYDEENKSWRFNGGNDKVYLSAKSCRAAHEKGE